MASNNIDISQQLLKQFSRDLRALDKLLFNALDLSVKLQITWEVLTEDQEGSTEH